MKERSPVWLETLTSFLKADPQAALGEIGLDRWVESPDIEAQEAVFLAQLDLAATSNRPVTIHCLQAWGRLLELLQSHPLPGRGFLLHSPACSAEMVPRFAELGAFFSFGGHFLHPRKAAVRDAFRRVPGDRLLVETDAPDMTLPEDLDRFALVSAGSDGTRINHPANLPAIYEGLARLRDVPLEDLESQVAANFTRLFG